MPVMKRMEAAAHTARPYIDAAFPIGSHAHVVRGTATSHLSTAIEDTLARKIFHRASRDRRSVQSLFCAILHHAGDFSP